MEDKSIASRAGSTAFALIIHHSSFIISHSQNRCQVRTNQEHTDESSVRLSTGGYRAREAVIELSYCPAPK
ncbi:MAG TPA: hypothetical protein VHQ88_12120, partial [Burkholderiales bacterium]|nr:hypothetical protein [Burkholderiales bacterium]